ncbi:MAG: AmmeMemoRadiSam system protein B [Candidatus Omnitrophota bacterium]
MLRKPVASGHFYPQTKEDILAFIEQNKQESSQRKNALGIILPHAGYVCSGQVAVKTVGSIIPKKTAVILGPNHGGLGESFSVWANGEWETPVGNIEINKELSENILKQSGTLKEDYLAHKFEHSIEVTLPIIKYFLGDFNMVAVSCKAAPLGVYRKIALEIFNAVKPSLKDMIFFASSDMTHYEPDQTVRKKDRQAIDCIVKLDEEALVAAVKKYGITMCGIAGVAILIALTKLCGAKKAQVIMYQTSGDTCSDYNSVVGYAGITIS